MTADLLQYTLKDVALRLTGLRLQPILKAAEHYRGGRKNTIITEEALIDVDIECRRAYNSFDPSTDYALIHVCRYHVVWTLKYVVYFMRYSQQTIFVIRALNEIIATVMYSQHREDDLCRTFSVENIETNLYFKYPSYLKRFIAARYFIEEDWFARMILL